MKGRDLKPHIGIYGRRNNGKSSFINALVNQEVAIVSDIPGTTTDPVKKSIEIFGIGPVVMIDTAGYDDSGELGSKRVVKSLDSLRLIDCAVLLIAHNTWGSDEDEMVGKFKSLQIPFIVVHNKADIEPVSPIVKEKILNVTGKEAIELSALTKAGLPLVIKSLIDTIPPTAYTQISLFEGLVKKNDYVLLVTPIDSEAPEGRMILPQVMALRDVLDNYCICIILRETELEHFFKTSKIVPSIVVTDSQAFGMVSKIVPENIPLTGFSVLFARLKGNFEAYLAGSSKLSRLQNGDSVLIMESCTHRVSCDDIGRFKLPNWITKFSGKELNFEFVSGHNQATKNLNSYALVIQCGGCMFTRSQVLNKLKPFIDAGVPVTNYGMAIAYMHGIFARATQMFKNTNS